MQERIESIRNKPPEVVNIEFENWSQQVWDSMYLKGRYGEAANQLRLIDKYASDFEVGAETRAGILANYAWSEYRRDIDTKIKSNESWVTAKKGLKLLSDSVINHETRSRLLEVAGLCQAYLVDERDELAEPLLKASLEETEQCPNPARIGEATNGLGLLYFARARKEKDPGKKKQYYEQAIPFFESAAKIHEEAKTKDEKAGHPYNNLTECYSSVGRYEDALKSAEIALEKYKEEDNPMSPHCFSARFRKSLALRRLGKETKDKKYFEQALAIYEEHKRLREQDVKFSNQEKEGLIRNEDANISNTQKEMQELGFV